MVNNTKVSIIIINYNYGLYLEEAINSSLSQKYENLEVIVVDDGSTDNSQEIINNYGDRIRKIFQKNSGMAEASNAGFKISNGDIIIFLDADDYLYDNAISSIVSAWGDGISKLHFRLRKIDDTNKTIGFIPDKKEVLSSGDVYKVILKTGDYINTPTSGNAFSRQALEEHFPINDARIGDSDSYFDLIPTDAYLKYRVPFFGPVIAIEKPLGVYRIHDDNKGAKTSPYVNEKKRQRVLRLAQKNAKFIESKSKKMGMKSKSNFLFNNNKMIVFRLLSYRFDGNAHPWEKDSKILIIGLSIKLLLYSRLSSVPRNLYNFLILLLVSFLPKIIVEKILRIVHPKSFNNNLK